MIVPIFLLESCQREVDWSGSPEIKATVEVGEKTRTSLSVNETGAGTIVWNPADQIDVFFGSTKAGYTSQNTSDAISALFKTTATLSDTDVSSTNIWGLYPSNSSSSCNGSSITTVLPSTQYGVPNTFDDDLFLAVAHSTTKSLQFYNVCGGIKFNLAYDDIKKITFRGNNNENLAGTVSISFVNDVPQATIVNGVKEITLTPKTGTTFTKGEDYYFTLLPSTLSAGFTMTFTATDGTTGTLNYTDKSVTIKRSVFARKGNMDVYAMFADDRQANDVIYYTSTDGKVVSPYFVAGFGANIVSNEYVDGRGIITFDRNVTSIGSRSFFQCSTLEGISLPTSVTSIEGYAFAGCISLEDFTIPESVTTIGASAFNACKSLTSIVIPESVSSIGIGPFAYCTSLSSIVVAVGNQVFDSRDNCNAIIETSINALVSGCKNTVIPDSVVALAHSVFAGHNGLTSITIPSSVTTIAGYAFYECSGLTSITVGSKTPPTLSGQSSFYDTNNCPIYVPAGSVDDYKSAWSDYADRIHAMGEFYEAVDLGLPSGLKWATCNIGASSPEEYGDYYAWGETEPYYSSQSPLTWKTGKTGYNWDSYQWCNGSSSYLTKYNTDSSNGVVDNKTFLDLSDDAARANWGGNWRTPTEAEWAELRSYCTLTWTTHRGVYGYRVTSKVTGYTDKSIFLPATGWLDVNLFLGVGSSGLYWSSSLYTSYPADAMRVRISSDGFFRGSYSRYYGLSVRPVYSEFISVSSVALNKSSLTLIVGESETLIPTVMPENATEKQVSWTSSNTSVATVSSEGTVTAQSAGTATITATASDGMKSATCTVTVTQSVTGLSISPGNPTIYTGEQVTLTATVTPSTASNPSVSWTSSDSSVAFVSSDGQVLGLKAGIAVITAQANDGSGVSATCTVTVKQHVTSVSLNTEAQIAWGGSMQLSATVLPADASDKSLTWSSSDESVASVSASGHVTGNLNGTASITATSVDGGYSASCVVTVTLPTTRSHLALVLSKNGDAASRYYLTSEQYSKANLSGYYKQGVCVFASSSYYIIANKDLYTSTSGSNANGAATMPNEELATWLISNMPSLNSALTSFGCTAMSTTGNYWTSKKRGDKYYYYFKYNGSLTFDSNASASCRARPVISF